MRHFTAMLTRAADQKAYQAVSLDLPLPAVTGRSLTEVQDNLLTAMQRHIDLTCELACEARGDHHPTASSSGVLSGGKPPAADPAKGGCLLLLEIPEYLLTRN
ncbi:MAG: hypothetical protein ACM3RP_11875 [Chitinophagales bacterium]